MPSLKRSRVTYAKLCRAVDSWNASHNLTHGQKGFLSVQNDGNVHWLAHYERGGVRSVGGTDGTCRSCMMRLSYLSPPVVSVQPLTTN